jgi:hypothetical protein
MTGDDYNKVLAVTTAGYVVMETIPFDPLTELLQQHGCWSTASWDRDPKDCASPLVPVHGRRLGHSDSISASLVESCPTQMLTTPV